VRTGVDLRRVTSPEPDPEVLLTVEGAARLLDEVVLNQFLVTLGAGAPRQPVLERVRTGFPGAVLTAHQPADIVNLSRVRRLPDGLAAILGGVALATIGHTLITSVRRRRQDLAVLKALGFVGAQVVRTVIWQATTLLAVALVIGVPLGVVLGRLGWKLLVETMALPVEPVLPLLWLSLLVMVGLASANLIAVGPALGAARTRTAKVC